MTPRSVKPVPVKRCSCHSSNLYDNLTTCPACGHHSLDRGRTWEGCERRACGYERTFDRDEASE